MRVKAYLCRYRELSRKIEEYDERIQRMAARAEKLTSRELDGMPSGRGETGANDAALAALADLRKQERKALRAFWDSGVEIEQFISEIDNAVYRDMLTSVYLAQQTAQTLPFHFRKSASWCRRTHKLALEAAEELYARKFPADGADGDAE